MTLELKITIPQDFIGGDNARFYLANALSAIGYAPSEERAVSQHPSLSAPYGCGSSTFTPDAVAAEAEAVAEQAIEEAKEKPASATTSAIEPKTKRGRPKAADKPQISTTPEARVGPEDSPEDAAQDAEDEAAEMAEKAGEAPAPTLDDVRHELGRYVQTFGMPATQEDGPKLISGICGAGKVKVSDIPDDKIAVVLEAIRVNIEANTFGRKVV